MTKFNEISLRKLKGSSDSPNVMLILFISNGPVSVYTLDWQSGSRSVQSIPQIF